MDKGWDCTVFCRKDGRWISKSNTDDGVMTVHVTKKEAIDAAIEMLSHHGGGKLTVKGKDGKVKTKDTIKTSTGYLESDILLSSA